MKKWFIISILTLVILLLGSTYFVGVQVEKTLHEQVAQLDSPDVDVQLLSYQKSFFHAKADFKVSISMPERPPLELNMTSDITHYPYKASSVNQMQLVDKQLQETLNSFFQTEHWFNSKEEINLLGKVQGSLSLPKGVYQAAQESLETGALTLNYDYDLNNHHSDLNLQWGGFHGVVDNEHFAADDIAIFASFVTLEAAHLVDYQYQASIDQFQFEAAGKKLALQQVNLTGSSTTTDDRLSLDSQNDWQIKTIHNGPQVFTDSEFSLALDKLNLAALSHLKRNLDDPGLMHQAFADLVSLGVDVDIKKLTSKTPWGEVNANLSMDIQPNVGLKNVMNNPLMLIDYSNGALDMSLPQALLGQSDFTGLLQVALSNGILAQQQGKLRLQATLDRGELTINDRVIPM